MKRYCIDVSQIVYGTGVSVYTKELVRAMLPILDKDEELMLYAGSLRRQKELRDYLRSLGNKGYIAKFFPIPPTVADVIFNRARFSLDIFIGRADVVHTSDWTEPRSKAHKITTIHDLAPLKYPEYTPKVIYEVHKRRLELVRDESDCVIVPSEATKKDCIDFGIAQSKLAVVPEAPSPEFKKASEADVLKVRSKYGITGTFALIVGTAYRKNLDRTISAFETTCSKAQLDRLVVVGNMPKKTQGHENVMYLGHVESSDLAALYTGATVLVYPSLYEGFGLPIIEAFQAGTPVVTSNISSMPEAAGGAAFLVDPTDINQIAQGILKAVEQSEILVKKGNKQLLKFSWHNTAQATLELYRQLA